MGGAPTGRVSHLLSLAGPRARTMTARLATHADVTARAPEVLQRLVAAGVDVEPVSTGAPPDADPITGLKEHGADLAIVGVGALRGTDTEGLTMLAVLPREDPRDVLVTLQGEPASLAGLPPHVRVGVAGPRRRALLAAHRPDLEAVALPTETHSGRRFEGVLHAAVLGLGEARRAGLGRRTAEVLDPRAWLPEPGQGVVALMARHPIAEVTALDHLPTRTALRAELALLDALRVDPDAALGCVAQPSGRLVRLWAAVASPDGRRFVRSDLTAPLDEAELLGAAVARQLRERGAEIARSAG